MEMIDFTNCELNNRMYGGLSGQKIGVIFDGENYILKFPDNLKTKNLKNVVLSYSNNAISEYIGSHVYK